MKKSICLFLISLITIVFLTGCATHFSNPIRSSYAKTPTIRVVQQGSIPAVSVYRSNFYIVSTNANTRFLLTAEVIAQMVVGGLTVISDITDNSTERYYNMLKNNYRWRTDIFVSGIDKLTNSIRKVFVYNF